MGPGCVRDARPERGHVTEAEMTENLRLGGAEMIQDFSAHLGTSAVYNRFWLRVITVIIVIASAEKNRVGSIYQHADAFYVRL